MSSTGIQRQRALEYWFNKAKHLALPPAGFSPAGEKKCATLAFPAALSQKLKAVSKGDAAVELVVCMAALFVLLEKYNVRKPVVSAVNLRNQPPDPHEPLAFFSADCSGTRTAKEVVGTIQQQFGEAVRHDSYDLVLLSEMLTVNNAGSINSFYATGIGHRAFNDCSPESKSKFSLYFDIASQDEAFALTVYVSADHQLGHFAGQVGRHFMRSLQVVLTSATQVLSRFSLLDEGEVNALAAGSKRTVAGGSLHALFESQAFTFPDRPAVVDGARTLTYRQLNDRADRLAGYLQSQFAVKPGDAVGLLLDQSHWAVIGILGILKAGATYIPIDPAHPEQRIAYMLRDAAPKVLIANAVPGHADIPVVLLGRDWDKIESAGPLLHHRVPADAHRIAYVIYTSGSTGTPKGVRVSHRAVVNLVEGLVSVMGHAQDWKYVVTAALTFDASVKQIFVPLAIGAELHIPGEREDVGALVRYLRDKRIDAVHATPLFWREILEAVRHSGTKPDLKCISSGGDRLSARLANDLRRCFGEARFYNTYGPTEACINCLAHQVEGHQEGGVPIGRPLPNYEAYILNDNNEVLPPGATGELCVAGEGLAAGYLHRADLTEASFVDNPFASSGKLYKTGDLARWLPDGTVEFLGRKDNQVKIRGVRVEPGEIEAALMAHEQVRAAVVLGTARDSADNVLKAYIIRVQGGGPLDYPAYLRQLLPDYLIPAYFTEMEAFPLTASGKLDVAALPEAALTHYAAPANERELTLQRIWQKVLQRGRIGVHDNFFQLGGHSLKGVQVIAQVNQALGTQSSLRDLFTHPTIASLSTHLASFLGGEPSAIPVVPAARYHPLSNAQRRIWIAQAAGGGSVYNIPGVYELKNLDVKAFEAAFREIIERHESLRTTFAVVDGIPRQVVHPYEALDFALARIDLRYRADARAHCARLAHDEATAVFDLERGPLVRGTLIALDEATHLLLLTLHHIISDGWSMGVMANDLLTRYGSLKNGDGQPLPPLRMQYKDYTAWFEARLNAPQSGRSRSYWLKQFEGELPVLELSAGTRPPVKTLRGASLEFRLERELSEGLHTLGLHHGSTLFMTLLAVVKTLIYRYTNQKDLIIGTPVSGRLHADLENQVGFYVNTIALRTQLAGDETFEHLLRQIRATTLDAYEHQEYPFDLLVESLKLTRHPSRSPLFDVRVEVQQGTNVNLPGFGENGWREARELLSHTTESKDDLHFLFYESAEGLALIVTYNTDLFAAQYIQAMGAHFKMLARSIISDPRQPIRALAYLTEGETDELLHAFNRTQSTYPADKTVAQLFEEQVQKNPAAVAIVHKEHVLTYDELNRKANQLAHYLRNEHGVGCNTLVGVLMNRSHTLIISLLGILKAGACYLPVAVDSPEKRRSYIWSDANVDVVVTETEFMFALGEYSKAIVAVDLQLPALEVADHNPGPTNSAEDLAYIIYTSGSTGKPKGVMITQRSMVNTLTWRNRYYHFDAGVVNLQFPSYSFDSSVEDIFCVLLSGGRLVIPDERERTSVPYVAQLLKAERVTHFLITPSFYKALLAELNHQLSGLKAVTIAGEAVTTDIVEKHYQLLPGVPLVNEYGPTENAVCSSATVLEPGKAITIGKPIANVRICVLDENLALLPKGVVGEICVSGPGLARGYLNNPEMTAAKFLPSPLPGIDRIYRTGDTGRWTDNGELVFHGRNDDQVKIRGYRVEVAEVENAIREAPHVHDAFVLARKGEPRTLVAYVIAGNAGDAHALKSFLARQLPDYMIPAHFVFVASFHLTINGKIDRQALPDPEAEPSRVRTLPRNRIEECLVEIWQDVLGKQAVDVYDNFFVSGGDSIKAIQVASRMNTAGYRIEVADILRQPVIAELGPLVKVAGASADQGAVVGPVPLTPIQQWFFSTYDEHCAHYNQAVLLQTRRRLTREDTLAVFDKLLRQHDALRMVFYKKEGRWFQENKGTGTDVPLIEYDLSGHSEGSLTHFCQKVQSLLDLGEGPAIRVGLFHLAESDRLFIAVHHLVIDGVSWRILFHDLGVLYEQVLSGAPLALPPKTNSFRDWAAYLQDCRQRQLFDPEADYWQRVLRAPSGTLQRDFSGGQNTFAEEASVGFSLHAETTGQLLRESHRAYRTEINDILLAALAGALCQMWRSDQFLVWLEGHGREALASGLDVTRTVGWFTTVYPVVLEMMPDPGAQIITTKENLRRVPNKGVGYGVLKQLASAPLPEPAGPKVLFNYLGRFDEDISKSTFTIAGESAGSAVGRTMDRVYDWTITGIVSGGRLGISVTFSDQMYDAALIRAFCGHYQAALERLIAHCCACSEEVLTPSDFAFKAISTAELAAMGAQYGKIEDVYTLSPMQQGLLFQSLLDKTSGAYFNQMWFDAAGEIDIALVEESLNTLTNRHPALRTAFYRGASEHLQLVLKHRQTEFRYEDIRHLEDWETKQAYMEASRAGDRERAFDLSKDPLMRMAVFRWDDTAYRYLWSHHHILMDGWCVGILVSEYMTIYEGLFHRKPVHLPPSTAYRAYIEWLSRLDTARSLRYWSAYLKEYHELAAVPAVRDHAQTREKYHPETITFQLSAAETAALGALVGKYQVTLNTIVQTIWGCLLGKYNGRKDVVFGAVVSGRPAAIQGIEKMIGLFINTIPVRISWTAETTFEALIKQVQAANLAAEPHHYCSLADIQAQSELKQNLLDHLLVFENYPEESNVNRDRSGALFEVSNVHVHEQTNYHFNLLVATGEALTIKFMFNNRVYDPRFVGRMAGHFRRFVEHVVGHPQVRIDAADVLPPAEREALLNGQYVPGTWPGKQSVAELFSEQAVKCPGGIAVVSEDTVLTYGELDRQTDQLARYLQTEFRVQPNDLVGVLVDRSPLMIVALLGVLKSGAAYVPVDPQYPRDRIDYILSDSNPRLVVTQDKFCNLVGSRTFVRIEDIPGRDAGPARAAGRPAAESVAYVIYTSGSSGRPKGVVLTHANVTAFVGWAQEEFRHSQFDVVYATTSYCFDLSIFEIFYTLSVGKRIRMLPSGLYIQAFLDQDRRVLINTVPSVVEELVGSGADLRNVSVLNMAGEVIPRSLIKKIDCSAMEVRNLYGPSEDTTYSSCYRIRSGDADIPVGKPIGQTRFYVVSEDLALLPQGVPGEICITGAGLAAGYLNQAELTASKFIESPFRAGEKLYRTGDIGYWMADGNLMYVGRKDNQVKLRGYRIELGEVEAALMKNKLVKNAIVSCRLNNRQEKVLVAHLVAEAGFGKAEADAFLQAALPSYMIPEQLVFLAAFPLTPNGKIDRSALPDAPLPPASAEAQPEDETERKIARIWEQILGVRGIGAHDNFFAIGGHSLKALQVVSRINKEFGVDLEVRTIFENPGLRNLAHELKRALWVLEPAQENTFSTTMHNEIIL